ncbi:MAG: cation:proton antiporter [Dehalococcoidia bacterium]|nr:cation:proton antiporter [Dehalococcoidia bacterium]
MTAAQILGLAGILLIIGFLADYLFRKTSIPDVLILITLGYLIEPVLYIVDPSDLAPASQIIATLSLVVILFHGGLDLDITTILSSAHRATILVFLGIAISMAATAAFVYYLLDWGLLHSLLLGAIVGGTSPSIVMPLISRARVTDEVSSVLSLESALNGALVIIIALVILQIMTTGTEGNLLSMAGKAIGIQFCLGAAVGTATGIIWLWLLTRLKGQDYDDILTLAVVFVLYFIVESMNGSGVIFALVFGLVLGNGIRIPKLFTIRRTVAATEIMKKFHSQISFFIKTFFFIYLGLIMTFNEPRLIILSLILSLLLLFVRYLVVLISSLGNRTLLANKGLLTTMFPRGLSAAVLAQIVVTSGIPDASIYPDIIIPIILITVMISAIGIPVFARRAQRKEPQ